MNLEKFGEKNRNSLSLRIEKIGKLGMEILIFATKLLKMLKVLML